MHFEVLFSVAGLQQIELEVMFKFVYISILSDLHTLMKCSFLGKGIFTFSN